MSFLTAEWRKLAMFNYVIDPDHLRPLVPFGTELDLWRDRCYISLIGFRFLETRLLGVKVPFHVNFTEVNLRFYVRRRENNEWKRGVVFIKEIVNLPALAFIANTLYGEAYAVHPVGYEWTNAAKGHGQRISYRWKARGEWNEMAIIADTTPRTLEAGSETEFITEHYWGYSGSGPKKTTEYEVRHPRWESYPVNQHQLTVNFESTYGPSFAFLDEQSPDSVILMEGSPISIEGKRSIKH